MCNTTGHEEKITKNKQQAGPTTTITDNRAERKRVNTTEQLTYTQYVSILMHFACSQRCFCYSMVFGMHLCTLILIIMSVLCCTEYKLDSSSHRLYGGPSEPTATRNKKKITQNLWHNACDQIYYHKMWMDVRTTNDLCFLFQQTTNTKKTLCTHVITKSIEFNK